MLVAVVLRHGIEVVEQYRYVELIVLIPKKRSIFFRTCVNDVDHDMLGNFSWCLVKKQRKIRKRKRKRKRGKKQRARA